MNGLTILNGGDKVAPDEASERLAIAVGKPVWVKLSALPKDAIDLLTPAMVRAKAQCRHCHGCGTRGKLLKTGYSVELQRAIDVGTAIPCKCLVVDVTALKALIKELQETAEVMAVEQKAAEDLAAATPVPVEPTEAVNES